MKWILIDDKTRMRIIRKAAPQKDDFYSYQNLNLLTGVYDEQSGVILTKTYYLCEGIKRTGDCYNDAAFIILTGYSSFIIRCAEYTDGEKYRNIKSPCPMKLSDSRLKEMLNYYNDNYSEESELKRKAFEQAEYAQYSRYGFTEQYLERNYFGKNIFGL